MDSMENGVDSSIFKEVLKLIIDENKENISSTYIQRLLGIGYNQACDILTLMEQKGIVSPPTVKFMRDERAIRNDSMARDIAKEKGFDPNKAWTVMGSFDAQNSFGATIRCQYVAIVVFEHKNEYKVLDVEIIE